MKIDLYLTPAEVTEEDIQRSTTIVVDVLRASTTIVTALARGCWEVIPTGTIESALELAQKVGRDAVLLCGEREGMKIEGFDLGNSPQEYREQVVKDKILILATTNGSRAIVRAKGAKAVLVGSFVNFTSLLDYVVDVNGDVVILCAGKEGKFSLEDAVCGGMLVEEMVRRSNRWTPNDAAKMALLLSKRYSRGLLTMLRNCSHGKYLRKLGFDEDLRVCAQVDSIGVVPVLEDGRLVKASP